MTLPKRIIVATDFSPESEKALEYALELAQKFDASVHLVHGFVVPVLPGPEAGLPIPPDVITSMEKAAQKGLQESAARHAKARVPIEAHLKWEDPRHAVVDVAKEINAELVVIGTHGRKGLKRALLGSVAESVVRFAPCPVLTVR
jgi:nucleotide-binding universal stress UspA family protein